MLCPDAEYEKPELYWWLVIVSLITLCEVELIVELPLLNCGTTGVARVLIGNANKTNQKSLVNFNADSSRTNTASTTSTSSTRMDS